jgi:hypothetical protein
VTMGWPQNSASVALVTGGAFDSEQHKEGLAAISMSRMGYSELCRSRMGEPPANGRWPWSRGRTDR